MSGPSASRSLPVGGAALWTAGKKIIEKAREIVAHQLEVSADDLDYAHGTFSVKGSPDKEMTVKVALPQRRQAPAAGTLPI